MGPVILGAMEMIVFIQQKSTFIVCSPELQSSVPFFLILAQEIDSPLNDWISLVSQMEGGYLHKKEKGEINLGKQSGSPF